MKMGTSCYQYELDLQDFSPLQDELLDFSGKDISKTFNAVDAHLPQFNYTVSTGGDKLDWTQFANELAIPTDEEAELEWLSKFIEDSEKCESLSSTIFQNAASVPSKTRSKRSRSANNSWISTDTPPNEIEVEEKTKNRTRRRDSSSSDVLRCTHCQSEKTPQWRMGPLGPKTLCNACGVRYKSGRLVPEYRPAASPTFVLTQHSNSHRKVMELRKQKEMLRQEGFQVY